MNVSRRAGHVDFVKGPPEIKLSVHNSGIPPGADPPPPRLMTARRESYEHVHKAEIPDFPLTPPSKLRPPRVRNCQSGPMDGAPNLI